jgi:hypothetical protein
LGSISKSFTSKHLQPEASPKQSPKCAFLRHFFNADFPNVSACFLMLPIWSHTNSTPVDHRLEALPAGFFLVRLSRTLSCMCRTVTGRRRTTRPRKSAAIMPFFLSLSSPCNGWRASRI